MKIHKHILALKQLRPTAGFSWVDADDYSTLKYYSDEDDKPTESAIIEQAKTSENIQAFKLLRQQRNQKLSETDWWSGSDLTMTADQTAYRKALRDYPATASPELDENGELTNVTWPTKPE
jgi:hypothetical protein